MRTTKERAAEEEKEGDASPSKIALARRRRRGRKGRKGKRRLRSHPQRRKESKGRKWGRRRRSRGTCLLSKSCEYQPGNTNLLHADQLF